MTLPNRVHSWHRDGAYDFLLRLELWIAQKEGPVRLRVFHEADEG